MIRLILPCLFSLGLLAAVGCTSPSANEPAASGDTTTRVELPVPEGFRQTVNGAQTDLYVISNPSGVQAAITNYGARLVGLWVPDKDGRRVDVVLGYDSLAPYREDDEPFFGATVGRYANRVAGASFSIDGRRYQLEQNDRENTLHSGKTGFHTRVWQVKGTTDSSLVLFYQSPNGEGGFPGTLGVQVKYTLTHDNALRIDYEATTDKTTVVNLTNHSYFNLEGEGSGSVLDHQLTIDADSVTATNFYLIPTGKLQAIAGTPLDFRKPAAMGQRIDAEDELIKNGKGYDHNFVLNKEEGTMSRAAVVQAPKSGIVMEVWTTEPAIQLYSGNFLNKEEIGKGGKVYDRRQAFCLETQHFPDAPNQPRFPSTLLKPGETFRSTTLYRFSIAKP
jgi:aldose 1-epimerase